jgi:hypothetical protein
LLTCDKDFGELVYRQALTHAGVVLIRLDGLSSESKGTIVSLAIKDHLAEMQDAFTVTSPRHAAYTPQLPPF